MLIWQAVVRGDYASVLGEIEKKNKKNPLTLLVDDLAEPDQFWLTNLHDLILF